MTATYLREDASPKKAGDLIFRPNLARTLEIIAAQGPDAFYNVGPCSRPWHVN